MFVKHDVCNVFNVLLGTTFLHLFCSFGCELASMGSSRGSLSDALLRNPLETGSWPKMGSQGNELMPRVLGNWLHARFNLHS